MTSYTKYHKKFYADNKEEIKSKKRNKYREYALLREIMKKKYNYKCCECDKNKRKLILYHINQKSLFTKKYKRYNNSEKNLIVLCYSCYAKKHPPKNYFSK